MLDLSSFNLHLSKCLIFRMTENSSFQMSFTDDWKCGSRSPHQTHYHLLYWASDTEPAETYDVSLNKKRCTKAPGDPCNIKVSLRTQSIIMMDILLVFNIHILPVSAGCIISFGEKKNPPSHLIRLSWKGGRWYMVQRMKEGSIWLCAP